MEKVSNYICKSEKSFENLSHFVDAVSGAGIEHHPEADGTIRVQISAADEKTWERLFIKIVQDPDIMRINVGA
jgi:hypothetical protein